MERLEVLYSKLYRTQEAEEINQFIADSKKKQENSIRVWQDILAAFQKAKPVQVVKVGRNDPCPCGSGKKYKKFCGK